MPHVERSHAYESSPEAMWERIGAFDGLHSWHPAIVETKMSEDGVRELVLSL